MSENAATHVEPVRQPIRTRRSLGKSRMAAGELSADKDRGPW